jgi:hypothetical protein
MCSTFLFKGIRLLLFLALFTSVPCKTIEKESNSSPFETIPNPNFIFFFGEIFQKENSIFDSQKIEILRDKKDLSNLLNQPINQKKSYFCESLSPGFHRFDFKITLTRNLNWKGRELIVTRENGFLNSYKSHLLYMAPQETYILTTKFSDERKLNLTNSILQFYLFPLFPFGFYPTYERNLEMKFLPIQKEEEKKIFLECCSPNRKSMVCEDQIQKMITSYGVPYGDATNSN